MINAAFKRLLYAFFPRRCELCGEVVSLKRTRCEACENAKRISGKTCPKCGDVKEKCRCEKDKFSPQYKAIAARYYYKDSIKAGIVRFKNFGFTELDKAIGGEIAETVKERFGDVKFDLITSVPLTKKKLRKRGYNQSELLAKEVSRRLGIPYEALLDKIRETKAQRFSSARERRVNIYGAFDIKDGVDVEGKTVLLIDDVKTTGSTLSECAAMLKGYGAKGVYAAAFAITDYGHKKNDRDEEKN